MSKKKSAVTPSDIRRLQILYKFRDALVRMESKPVLGAELVTGLWRARGRHLPWELLESARSTVDALRAEHGDNYVVPDELGSPGRLADWEAEVSRIEVEAAPWQAALAELERMEPELNRPMRELEARLARRETMDREERERTAKAERLERARAAKAAADAALAAAESAA